MSKLSKRRTERVFSRTLEVQRRKAGWSRGDVPGRTTTQAHKDVQLRRRHRSGPVLGSGTTMKVALSLNRNAIGYEINKEFLSVMKEKIGLENRSFTLGEVQIVERENKRSKLTAHARL
jgi:hypothetical protein